MRRIGLAVVFVVSVLAPLTAEAPPTQRVYRIGFLGQTSPADYSSRIAALREGLHDAGYREGADLFIEYRWAEGRLARLPSLASFSASRSARFTETTVAEGATHKWVAHDRIAAHDPSMEPAKSTQPAPPAPFVYPDFTQESARPGILARFSPPCGPS